MLRGRHPGQDSTGAISSAVVILSRRIFFFNDTATPEIYTLSLHDALPISAYHRRWLLRHRSSTCMSTRPWNLPRSEEHTSELQSRLQLVCRLLLEKKK